MATAEDLSPSVKKAFYMRLNALIVGGSLLVLRNIITTKYPGTHWTNHLNKPHVRAHIVSLKNFKPKVISQEQYDLLYPVSGTSDPSKYDISLMVCLLRHVCGLNSQSPVWTGVPASMDHSEEADIRRLNLQRNKMAHISKTSLSQEEFQNRWLYIEEILLRLGSNIPDLQQNIDNLMQQNIDPNNAGFSCRSFLLERLTYEMEHLREDREEIDSLILENSKSLSEFRSLLDVIDW